MQHPNPIIAALLDAAYSALNLGMAAHIAAESFETCKGLDVNYHMDKLRHAIQLADPHFQYFD